MAIDSSFAQDSNMTFGANISARVASEPDLVTFARNSASYASDSDAIREIAALLNESESSSVKPNEDSSLLYETAFLSQYLSQVAPDCKPDTGATSSPPWKVQDPPASEGSLNELSKADKTFIFGNEERKEPTRRRHM